MVELCGGNTPSGTPDNPRRNSDMNSSTLDPVASRILWIDSVDGQRCRPSAELRLDLLNDVGSSPALRARPDGLRSWRAASESIASQILSCENMARRPFRL